MLGVHGVVIVHDETDDEVLACDWVVFHDGGQWVYWLLIKPADLDRRDVQVAEVDVVRCSESVVEVTQGCGIQRSAG